MGRSFNWDRPRYRTEGRATEGINGDDLSAVLAPKRPRKPQPSKAELREQAERAVREFAKRW